MDELLFPTRTYKSKSKIEQAEICYQRWKFYHTNTCIKAFKMVLHEPNFQIPGSKNA